MFEDVLPDVEELLTDSEDLPGPLQHYIRTLAREVQAALDDQELGDGFDFQGALTRLWMALGAAAGHASTPEKQSAWRAAAQNIFINATGAALGGMPSMLTAIAMGGA